MSCNSNAIVANLIQAMLGAVTPNWRAVLLKVNGSSVSLTFVLASESPDDRKEIADVEFEFVALQPECKVFTTVVVETSPIERFAEAGQLVFARNE